MNTTNIDSFLDSTEKSYIGQFVDNPIMCEAVKKVLLAGAYSNGTLKKGKPANALYNFALTLALDGKSSNEQVGADLRACAEGIRVIEQAFDAMITLKTVEEEEPKKMKHVK